MTNNCSLYLCGLSGCGKSTLGKRLAQFYKWSFIDLDSFIEEQQGLTISQIFEKHGEKAFRQLEEQALEVVIASKSNIVALGGGTLVSPSNRAKLQGQTIIFIDRPVKSILKTLDTSSRPLLKANTAVLYRHYQERYSLYCSASTAHLINDTSIQAIEQRLIAYIDTLKE